MPRVPVVFPPGRVPRPSPAARRWRRCGGVALAALALSGCGSSSGGDSTPPPLTGWAAVRAQIRPQVALTAEFGEPYVQPLAVDGWEDGIAISRDGLHLYAVYAPADLLSFALAGNDQTHAADYFRGPTFGMDMVTNPAGTSHWIHGNIVVADRASTSVPFTSWRLTAMARPTWSEGAPLAQGPTGSGWDIFAYTSNEHAPDYKAHICIARNAAYDPAVLGTMLPAPVTTSTTEDNPHVERLDATHLVLFFDSDDRPGGAGLHDIWYATSADDGASWSTPLAVTSLDSALEEEQPHLFRSASGAWRLYFTATNPADGKLGIFRAIQGTPGDWNSWTGRELVVGAGNAEGVGEPTLTSAGDLSFVVIDQDVAHGTPTNRFDGDPWFLPHRPGAITRIAPARPGASVTAAALMPRVAGARNGGMP